MKLGLNQVTPPNYNSLSQIENEVDDSVYLDGLHETSKTEEVPHLDRPVTLMGHELRSVVRPEVHTVLVLNPRFQRQVHDILCRCRPVVVGYESHTAHAVQQFYPAWGLLLLTTSFGGFLGGSDFNNGTSLPNPLPCDLPRQIAGLGQVGDTYITYDGIREANTAQKAASAACLNYLKAAWGLEALTQLEEALRHSGRLNGLDAACIQTAKNLLQTQKMRNYPTFTACLAREFISIRCMSAGFRDIVLGSVNILRTMPSIAATALSSGPQELTGSPTGLVKTVPLLGGPITVMGGAASLVQSVFEMIDAQSESQARDLAELHDKQVFAVYGAHCPELLPLMAYRDDLRQLKRLETRLLKVHAGVRGFFGVTSLVTGIATTALASTGSAVTLGALGLVNVGAAVGYMGWYATRARIAEKALKRYQKALQTVSTNRGDEVARSMRRPGLSAHALRPSIHQIVGDLVRACTDRGTGQQAIEALVALNIPRSVVEAAFADDAVPLGPCNKPWLGVLQPEFNALHIVLARKEASAQDKLNALMRLRMHEAQPPQLPRGADSNWVKHLAPGKHMGDLRRSTMTRDCFLTYWGQVEELRNLWERCEGNTANPPLRGTNLDGEGAWDALQDWRRLLGQQETAEATVLAWVDGGKFAEIRNCLNALRVDDTVRARRTALTRKFGFAPPEERDPQHLPHTVDDVVETLRLHALRTPLATDTMAGFLAVWHASAGASKPIRAFRTSCPAPRPCANCGSGWRTARPTRTT